MIRHTSATYWAPKLDRVTFCKRFGWSYNSSSPDRYIDFAKVTENKVVDIVKADKYTELSENLEKEKVRNQMMDEELNEIKGRISKVDKVMNKIAENPKTTPSIFLRV